MSMIIEVTVPFPLGHEVHIDGDRTITATVIGFMWTDWERSVTIRVGWMFNGESREAWFPDYRLSAAPHK